MKILVSALLLVTGTILLTFSSLSFALFPRSLTLANPTLLVEALFVAGLIFTVLGGYTLFQIHRVVNDSRSDLQGRVTRILRS
ncbi:MAG: hypothetical protein L0H70_01695 [Xanthomonadales bacterium]|nr:hypothetical protein [Xanthomonadales bacterium]